MNRRGFFASLIALPFVAKAIVMAKPKPHYLMKGVSLMKDGTISAEWEEISEMWGKAIAEYSITPDQLVIGPRMLEVYKKVAGL